MAFDYVGIDIETTGLDKNKDEVLEVVAIEFDIDGNIGEKIHQLCQPMSGFISANITSINNITMDMVAGKPFFFQGGVRDRIAAFIGDRTIVGHNLINFDLPFMKIESKKVQDTMVISREKYNGRHNLKACCRRLEIEWDENEAHRAEYDTLKCIELFCKIKSLENVKEEIEAQIPMFFGVTESTNAEELKKGVIPSDSDKNMMATQTYSYSRIKLYHQCPFKWYMQYIKGFKEPNRDYFMTGKICHSVAEWSGVWCYTNLFINKFEVFFTKNGYFISDKTKEGLAKVFKKSVSEINNRDLGMYLYAKPSQIKSFFPNIDGKASLISEMDKQLSNDEYEKPSMPPPDVYDGFIEKAIHKEKCYDVDVIRDCKRIMGRFYESKDFSILPGELTITEKKIALDRDWNVVEDFYSNEAYYRGIVDVIDYFGDHLVITDYKTSRTMLTIEQLKEDRQMNTYVLLVNKLLPKDSYKKIIIKIHYIRFGKTVEYEIDDFQSVVDKSIRWVTSSVSEIETEMLKTDGTAFRPIRNEFCHTCHLADEAKCPLFNKNLINNIDDPFTFTVSNQEDCKTAWKRIEANKAENKRLTALCKLFVKETSNPIVIDGNARLDFFTKEETKIDASEALKFLVGKKVPMEYIAKFVNMTANSLAILCESKGIELSEKDRELICEKSRKTTFDALTENEVKDLKSLN